MTPETLVKKSKWLSKHLRHSPEKVGLELEKGGWVSIEKLLAAARNNGVSLSRAQLEEVVNDNDKQRFAIDAAGKKIRASQGHSVDVDLDLSPQDPPDVLFHGTGAQNRDSIFAEGLHRGRRHHVHLSRDIQTAIQVGARHGKPLVFRVDALSMNAAGWEFFRSDNGVWLVEEVPPKFLSV